MHNMQLKSICRICKKICLKICKICRFSWYCSILHAICKICKIICTICKICKRHFQYAEYALPTLLMREKLNLFLFLFFGSNIRARRARRTPPAAAWGWLDCHGVACDSNWLLRLSYQPGPPAPRPRLRTRTPQAHLGGTRPVLDQSEAMARGSSGV